MTSSYTTLEDFRRDRHPEIPLFAVFMTPTEKMQPMSSREGSALLLAHFQFLLDLEVAGKLFASGPLDPGTPDQQGMCILAVPTLEDANALAQAEPFQQAGWRTNVVRRWQLNEGASVALGKLLTGMA